MPKQSDGGTTAIPPKGVPQAAAAQFEWLTATGNTLSDSLVRSLRTCMEQAMTINGQMMEFAAQRWQKNLDLSQELARCKDLGEAISLQQSWSRSFLQDYAEEIGKVMQFCSKAALESVQPVLQQSAQSVGTMPPQPVEGTSANEPGKTPRAA